MRNPHIDGRYGNSVGIVASVRAAKLGFDSGRGLRFYLSFCLLPWHCVQIDTEAEATWVHEGSFPRNKAASA
jgi:hypothetical protein